MTTVFQVLHLLNSRVSEPFITQLALARSYVPGLYRYSAPDPSSHISVSLCTRMLKDVPSAGRIGVNTATARCKMWLPVPGAPSAPVRSAVNSKSVSRYVRITSPTGQFPQDFGGENPPDYAEEVWGWRWNSEDETNSEKAEIVLELSVSQYVKTLGSVTMSRPTVKGKWLSAGDGHVSAQAQNEVSVVPYSRHILLFSLRPQPPRLHRELCSS